jgi:SAM-dependent methyltransferase
MTETTALYEDHHAPSEGWSEPFRWSADGRRYCAAELGHNPAGLDILEIGCGNGVFRDRARDRGARVRGLEITSASLAAVEAVQIPLVAPDLVRLGESPDAALEAVVAFDVFEQSPFGLDPQHADATHVVARSRAKNEQYDAGTRLRTLLHGATARVSSGNVVRDVVRALRDLLRGLHGKLSRLGCTTRMELAPVVTHVMIQADIVSAERGKTK